MKISGTGCAWSGACFAVLLVLISVTAPPTDAYVTSFPEEPDIDGILTTVGLTVAHWLAGLVPYPGVSALLNAIIYAMTPKPEDDYWQHIEQQVQETCGNFINNDNIDKVLVYKDDLLHMLEIYERSPVESDGSYPSKNVQADSITTSIITNRYLIEAAEMPWSMTLYFVDIASLHILILKDVAETYTLPDAAPSLWWKDLSTELGHYSAYANQLYEETKQFRKDNVECYFDAGKKLDEYIITDHVSGIYETCVQEHPSGGETGSCADACQNFEDQMVRNLDRWYMNFVGDVTEEWQKLKMLSDQMAAAAGPYRVPRSPRS